MNAFLVNRWFWALLLFWVSDLSGASSFPDFRIISLNEGLPQGLIWGFAQTEDEAIWLATGGGGLVRYNGRDFVSYTRQNGLRDDWVVTVHADRYDRIWAPAYSGGIAFFQGDTLVYPFEGHKLDESYITVIREAPDGSYWLGSYEKGLFIIPEEIARPDCLVLPRPEACPPLDITRLRASDGLANDTVWDIWWSEDGRVWVATHNGISVWDGQQFKNFGVEEGLSSSTTYKLVSYDGALWIATADGITVYRDSEFHTIHEMAGFALDYVYDLLASRDGSLWIGLESNGVIRVKGEHQEHFTWYEGLVSDHTWVLFEDRRGAIWMGSNENGITVFRGDGFRFMNHRSGLLADQVMALHRDRLDRIWIATTGGLQSYEQGILVNHHVPGLNPAKEIIWNIAEFSNGLLLHAEDRDLYFFDGYSWSPYRFDGLDTLYIHDAYIDRGDTLWLGTESGPVRVYGNEILTWCEDLGMPEIVIHHIYEDSRSRIWMATEKGAMIIENGNFSVIGLDEGLPHDVVNVITEDHEGNIWLGTAAGVTRWIDESQLPVHFGVEQGMKLAETLFLHFDEDDRLWQGTYGGIHRLDVAGYRQTGIMAAEHHRLSRHGVGVTVQHKAVLPMGPKKFWAGTENGLIEIRPGEMYPFRKAPRVHLVSMEVNGSAFFRQHAGKRESLIATGRFATSRQTDPVAVIPYHHNGIRLVFEAMEFRVPDLLEYRYRLDGLSEDWIPVRFPELFFPRLSPGDYTLHFQARTAGHNWSDPPWMYPFRVSTPYWQRSWFRVLAIALFGLIIYGASTVHRQRLERKRLRKQVEEKTRELSKLVEEKELLVREMHHRVKNNLSIIYSLLDMQLEKVTDSKAFNALRDSQMRIRSISMVHQHLSAIESNGMVDAFEYLSSVIQEVKKSFETSEKRIEVGVRLEPVMLDVKQALPCALLINEMMMNAYSHAFIEKKSGKISVRFTRQAGNILLAVEDDGAGIPEEYKHPTSDSLGMMLIHSLSSQIDGYLDFPSTDTGCRIEIRFPCET